MKKVFFIIFYISKTCTGQEFNTQWEYIELHSEGTINSEIIDIWEYYLENPIHLNDSNKLDEMKDLHLLSEREFQQIKTYCLSRKELISIYELQGLGVEVSSLKRIKPFIKVANNRGSKFKKSHRLFMGFKIETPYKKGYIERAFIGSPFKSHIRYQSHINTKWSIGLNWEKDIGEPLWYKKMDPNNLAINLIYTGEKQAKEIIIGKYDISIGEGLLLGTKYRINSPYFPNYSPTKTTKSCLSSKEYFYFQGTVFRWKIRSANIHLFASHKKLNGLTSIDKTGWYRTEEEITKRKTKPENLLGISISKKTKTNKLSWSGIYYKSDFTDIHSKLFQSFFFSINHFNLEYSGEFAMENLKRFACLKKLTASISNNSILSIQYRNRKDSFFNEYRSDYSIFSNGYEKGILSSFLHDFSKKWQIKVTFDHFKANFVDFANYNIASGRAFFSQISRQTEHRKFVFQYQNKQHTNSKEINKFILHYREQLSEGIKLNTKIICNNVSQKINSSLQSNFQWTSLDKKNKIIISYGSFHTITESIFWQAPYFYGSYNSKFLAGKGFINSISMQKKMNSKTKIGVQIINLQYIDRNSIGSGNDLIDDNRKLEILLYCLWKN